MTTPAQRRLAPRLRALSMLGLVLGTLGAAVALLAGPAYRMEWVSLSAGFLALRWGTYGAMAAAVIGALTWLALTVTRAPKGRAIAALSFVLGTVVAAPPLYMYDQAQRLPKIHDISTDTDDPPAFVDVLPLRKQARNPVDFRRETGQQQKQAYPDIVPMRIAAPPGAAFDRAERAARAMGWQIVSARPEAGRIEATDTTLLFGFKDDIVIRVRPDGQGSVVDMRSLSRIGGSDIGTNARRVRAFRGKLAGD